MSTKANEGPLFYRVAFWTVPMSRRFDARYGDAPSDIIIADVKSAEAAIREIRATVERLTRDAADGQLRNTGFGITVDQPATIHVVSVEWTSDDEFQEVLQTSGRTSRRGDADRLERRPREAIAPRTQSANNQIVVRSSFSQCRRYACRMTSGPTSTRRSSPSDARWFARNHCARRGGRLNGCPRSPWSTPRMGAKGRGVASNPSQRGSEGPPEPPTQDS